MLEFVPRAEGRTSLCWKPKPIWDHRASARGLGLGRILAFETGACVAYDGGGWGWDIAVWSTCTSKPLNNIDLGKKHYTILSSQQVTFQGHSFDFQLAIGVLLRFQRPRLICACSISNILHNTCQQSTLCCLMFGLTQEIPKWRSTHTLPWYTHTLANSPLSLGNKGFW